MDKEYMAIRYEDGKIEKVHVITFLISEDGMRNYIVYSKDETQGVDNDHIIYITKVFENTGLLTVEEIKEDIEWRDVQGLLKKIANSKEWYYELW